MLIISNISMYIDHPLTGWNWKNSEVVLKVQTTATFLYSPSENSLHWTVIHFFHSHC